MRLTLAWIALGVAALWAALLALDRGHRARRLNTLRAEWGRTRNRSRDFVAIAAYHRGRAVPDCGKGLDRHLAHWRPRSRLDTPTFSGAPFDPELR